MRTALFDYQNRGAVWLLIQYCFCHSGWGPESREVHNQDGGTVWLFNIIMVTVDGGPAQKGRTVLFDDHDRETFVILYCYCYSGWGLES